jgi:hypothetical protein
MALITPVESGRPGGKQIDLTEPENIGPGNCLVLFCDINIFGYWCLWPRDITTSAAARR